MGAIPVKKPDNYRFTLQWGAGTAEKVQAGEFLKSLGNKKSEVIVAAIVEYLHNHPEAMSAGRKPKIIVKASYTDEQLRERVGEMVASYASIIGSGTQSTQSEPDDNSVPDDLFVDEMIDNLRMFDS